MPGKTDCQKKANTEILSSFKKDFKNLTSKNLTRMQECVLGDVLHLSKNKINQLRNSFPNQTLDNKKDVKYENIKKKMEIYSVEKILLSIKRFVH